MDSSKTHFAISRSGLQRRNAHGGKRGTNGSTPSAANDSAAVSRVCANSIGIRQTKMEATIFKVIDSIMGLFYFGK